MNTETPKQSNPIISPPRAGMTEGEQEAMGDGPEIYSCDLCGSYPFSDSSEGKFVKVNGVMPPHVYWQHCRHCGNCSRNAESKQEAIKIWNGEQNRARERWQRVSREILVALVRRLLTEQIQGPRVWDADSIKDAPEGRYFLRESIRRGWNGFAFTFALESVKAYAKHYEGSDEFCAFGPIPQPPEKP